MEISVEGLEPDEQYVILLQIEPVGNTRFFFLQIYLIIICHQQYCLNFIELKQISLERSLDLNLLTVDGYQQDVQIREMHQNRCHIMTVHSWVKLGCEDRYALIE